MIGLILLIFFLIFCLFLWPLSWAVGTILGTIYGLTRRAIDRRRYGPPRQIEPLPRR